MQLTPAITDQCMSTGPSFPSESIHADPILTKPQSARKNLLWGQVSLAQGFPNYVYLKNSSFHVFLALACVSRVSGLSLYLG